MTLKETITLKDLNLKKNDLKYLLIITIFAFVTIFYRVRFHASGGVFSPDKAVYLINALMYSGMDYYHIANPGDIFFSPVISFLTSILFRMGLVDQLAISLVSSFFALFGYFGLYLLLKNKFNSLLSLTGVIIYGSITEFLLNLSSGLLDVPAISISIWILVLSIIGINRNSKYIIIIFPLCVIGFFTRYTVGLMIPVIIMYYLIKRDFIENLISFKNNTGEYRKKISNYLKSFEFKMIILSISLSITLFILISKYLILDFGGSLTFISQSSNTINVQSFTGGTDYNPDKLFYIKNFSEFLISENRALDRTFSYLLYSILSIGILIEIAYLLKKLNIKRLKEKFKIRTNQVLILLLIILIISSAIGFKVYLNHMIANTSIILSLLLINYLINQISSEKDKYTFTILNIGYFSIYFIFISLYPIKVLRYALPILPPFIYFVILGLNAILDFINSLITKSKEKHSIDSKKQTKYLKLIPIILIIIFFVSTVTFIEPMEIEGYSNSLIDASDYIISHDPNYHSKTFASNNHNYRLVKWDLNVNVSYIIGEHENPDSCNTTYIINWKKYNNLENYHKIYSNDKYHIYRHN